MADKNLEPRSGGVRIKSGVLPGVREIRRPDFSKKAADIEKAEAERALNRGEDTDAADEAAVRASLEAQESGTEEEQLDESAITDEALWYVAHTYSGYENKVKTSIEKTIENRRECSRGQERRSQECIQETVPRLCACQYGHE